MDSTRPPLLHLSGYHISPDLGFLLEDALEVLPEYFQAWNHLSSPSVYIPLLETHGLRREVNKMTVLDHTRLTGHRQLRLAHLQLSILVNGYVWQDGDQGVPKSIPCCLSVPFCGVSRLLEIQPILSHCDVALANWVVIDKQRPPTLDNIRVLYKLPGGEEGAWFFKATVGVELAYCSALQPLMCAVEAADVGDAQTLAKCLKSIAATVNNIQAALSRMHDGLSADTFYNVMRPFLTGWGGEGSPLPEGLVYEGVNDEPLQMTGGSAAQSSTVQSLDAALGITHAPDIQAFFDKMKPYMPRSHRQFLDDIQTRSRIATYVRTSSNEELRGVYQDCIKSLVDLRSYHIQIVTKYIIVPSGKKKQEEEKYRSVSNKGTGGSSILPFLKSARNTTRGTDESM
ncbi:myoglobin-like [Mizuhopecten yessoensis]|uniref:myoglobin-like n=1 Tax=Mizuhopecten yessoensis TaxID=6573 RepID=UPI000B458FE2|nr:myoglobin-like [Mizuhopecten yessoensis]